MIEAAAWSEAGELPLAPSDSNTGDHRIGLDDPERKTVGVRAVALDEVLPDPVDLLLLDTQATEHIALRVASELIRRDRPLVFVEYWPGGIRDAGGDPMAVLEEYRRTGFAVSGAEESLPKDFGELLTVVETSDLGFTTLRLDFV